MSIFEGADFKGFLTDLLLMIHAERTKEIPTTVKEVWKCHLNYHKIW